MLSTALVTCSRCKLSITHKCEFTQCYTGIMPLCLYGFNKQMPEILTCTRLWMPCLSSSSLWYILVNYSSVESVDSGLKVPIYKPVDIHQSICCWSMCMYDVHCAWRCFLCKFVCRMLDGNNIQQLPDRLFTSQRLLEQL